MHFGIITTKNSRYHPNRRLIEAATTHGHEVSLIDLKKYLSEIRSGRFHVKAPVQVNHFDAFIPRIGATINDYALTVVRHLELLGARLINGFQSILLTRSNFLCLQTLSQAGIPVPQSLLVRDFRAFKRAVRELGGYPVVAKTLNSTQGRGVMLVESVQMAEFIMDSLLKQNTGLLIQEFIPPNKRRDIRAFILGREVVSSIELKPRGGDFRSNIHFGAKGSPFALQRELAELAVRSSKVLGLEISGVDMMLDASGSPMVIEANHSPGFKGLEAATGLDIASRIIQYVTQTRGEVS
jgi:ribosomal protein S6--L-glutamate ligase